MKRTAGVLVAASLMVGLVFAQDALSLKPKPKVGATWKFKVSADVEIMGQNASFTAFENGKVTKIEDDGSYFVESSMTNMKVEFNGQQMDQPDQAPSTTKHSNVGEVLEVSGAEVTANDYRLGALLSVVAPKADIKTGEKWSVELKPKEKVGAPGLKSDYEVKAVEEVLGVKAAVVKVSSKETSGNTPTTMEGVFWVDLQTGFTIKADLDLKNVEMDGAPGPMNMKMKMEKVG